MERKVENRHWRNGFLAGIAALALSMGGQVATSAPAAPEACPLSRQPSVAQRLYDHFAPRVRANHGVAHRVALALIGAMLSNGCS